MSSVLLAVYVRLITHKCLYDCLLCNGAIEILKYRDGINAIMRIIVFCIFDNILLCYPFTGVAFVSLA